MFPKKRKAIASFPFYSSCCVDHERDARASWGFDFGTSPLALAGTITKYSSWLQSNTTLNLDTTYMYFDH